MENEPVLRLVTEKNFLMIFYLPDTATIFAKQSGIKAILISKFGEDISV